MKRTNLLYLIAVALLISINCKAQEEKNKKSDYQKSFDEFSKSINQQFETFKTKNDSLFYNFLLQSWKDFELFKDERKPLPKPAEQPKADTSVICEKKITPKKSRPFFSDTDEPMMINGKPVIFHTVENYERPTATFDFYGTQIKIPVSNKSSLHDEAISKKLIANYYKYASNNNDLLSTIEALYQTAKEEKLNGWGYLDLLRTASNSFYNKPNSRVLFTWFTLLKSGFDARVGYTNSDVYLLVAFDVPVFYKSYFQWSKKKYYLILFEGQNNNKNTVTSYQNNYPGELADLNLSFNELPKFQAYIKTKKVRYKNQEILLAYNANLTNFYNNYPECDLSIYFSPPLSNEAVTSIEKVLLPLMNNKTETGKINLLLDFVQHAIAYKTDEQQFGKENYFFAEETLRYPYADCEDRAVLLSQLIRHFLGLKTIAVVYPGHVSLAVETSGTITGAYVNYNSKRYYIADPTYIGAKTGMIMEQYKNVQPEIIVF